MVCFSCCQRACPRVRCCKQTSAAESTQHSPLLSVSLANVAGSFHSRLYCLFLSFVIASCLLSYGRVLFVVTFGHRFKNFFRNCLTFSLPLFEVGHPATNILPFYVLSDLLLCDSQCFTNGEQVIFPIS